MKTLHRYISRELLFPFVMGITIFTFILIMDKIFTLSDLIVKYGVSIFTVVKLLIFILPSTFAITIPMACLVAVIVVFSRLKTDNEITAMKASGISPVPLLGTLLVLGTLLTLAMIFFNNTILPNSNYAYRALYYDIVKQRAAIVVREHVFVEDFDGYVFRVGDKNSLTGELKDIVVFVRGQKPEEPVRTIFAKRGQLISDNENRRVMLQLENGYMQVVRKENPALFTHIDFKTTFLDLDINRELANKNRKVNRGAREMSMKQIKNQIAKWSAEGKDINLLRVEYHKKTSIPFACLAFVLIGAPAGILAPRSGRYFSYFIAVMLIFLYYIFISLGETFGSDGRLNPFLSMWLPNLLLTLAGIYGLAWVVKEHPPFFSRKLKQSQRKA
ncbi:LPS export ABC transporter permease LptF [bacterium]|nr:LPS export ABC transporter permease LptF [bacterium]